MGERTGRAMSEAPTVFRRSIGREPAMPIVRVGHAGNVFVACVSAIGGRARHSKGGPDGKR